MKNPNNAFFARDDAVRIQTFKSLDSKLSELFEVAKMEVENNRIGLIRPGFFYFVKPSCHSPQTKFETLKIILYFTGSNCCVTNSKRGS